MDKNFRNFENKIQRSVEEQNQSQSVSSKDISLKANKELEIYMKGLIQTMDGGNLNGMKIILDTCYGSATICAKKFLRI